MDTKTLFKQAHALTRATIQAGDDYRATFGLCLRAITNDHRSRLASHSLNTVYEAIGYESPLRAKIKRIDWQLVGIFAAMTLGIACYVCGIAAIHQMDVRNKASFEVLYNDTE